MRPETTDSAGASPTTEPTDSHGRTDGYRKAVSALHVLKLALGVVVSALTVLELLGAL